MSASDDGWWDEYSYARALVATEPDPETRETLAKAYNIDLHDVCTASYHDILSKDCICSTVNGPVDRFVDAIKRDAAEWGEELD